MITRQVLIHGSAHARPAPNLAVQNDEITASAIVRVSAVGLSAEHQERHRAQFYDRNRRRHHSEAGHSGPPANLGGVAMTELDEFRKFLARRAEAEKALVFGDVEPRMELWKRQDPVSCMS